MIYIQTDISIESIRVGGTVAKGVARKLILTNNSLHTATTAYVRDINDDPYLYELMPIDGLGFDFADYLPGEYTLAVIGEEDEVLVENILVLRTVDNMEIFYDEEYPSEVIDQIPVISLEILDTINGEIIGVGYADKTEAILESVLAIKAAIEEKGEDVGDDPLRTYADHIKNIETGSPATITIKQGDNEQSFQLNQKNDQTIEIVDGQPHWFGTRAEYDAIEEKDPDTIYHVKEPIPYDDISGKPVIGDGKITIKQGDNEQTFTLNQEGDQIIEIEGGGSDIIYKIINGTMQPDGSSSGTTFTKEELEWFWDRHDSPEVWRLRVDVHLNQHRTNAPQITYRGPLQYSGMARSETGDVLSITWWGLVWGIDAAQRRSIAEVIYSSKLNSRGQTSVVFIINHIKTDWDDVDNKPDFKPVATSGSYNDLDDKPIIEPVYDSFITIIQGGVEKGKFSLNQSTNQTIEIDAGGGDPHWFGTQAEYDAIPEKDPDTIYHIEGGSDDKHWFGTQSEYDAIEVKDPDMIYCIEGGSSGSYTPIVVHKNRHKEENAKAWEDILRIGTDVAIVYFEINEHYFPAVRLKWYNDLCKISILDNSTSGIYSLHSDGTVTLDVNRELALIGDIKNPKVTIKQGEKEQSFTLNQDTDVTIDLETGGSTTWDDIQDKPEFKTVATSGDYNDLTNKPEIPSIEGLASEQWVKDQGYLTEHQDISGKVDRSELAPVATSGDYNDLTNKPTIPSVEGLASEGYVDQAVSSAKEGMEQEILDTKDALEREIQTKTDHDEFTQRCEAIEQSIPSVEGLASEEYVGNELKKYLPLVGGTLSGHLTLGSTSETAYKKFEAIRKVNNEGNGAAFYVNSDGAAAFYHKSYSASGSATNDAILKFDSDGLQFATGGNRTTSATEFKKVLLEGDVPATPEPKYVDFLWPTDTESEEIDQEFAQELWDNRDKYSSGIYRIRIISSPNMPVAADFFADGEEPVPDIIITATVDGFMMCMYLTKVSGKWVIFSNHIRDFVASRIIHYEFPGFASGTVPASLYIAEFWNRKTQIENSRIIIKGGEESLGWPITFSQIAWFEDEEERQLVLSGTHLQSADVVVVTYQQFADKDPSKDDWQVRVSQRSVIHHSENWTFELEDGSTVTKNMWLG